LFGMVEKAAVVVGAVLRHAGEMRAEAAVEARGHSVWSKSGGPYCRQQPYSSLKAQPELDEKWGFARRAEHEQ
jgi:hypothetical protein